MKDIIFFPNPFFSFALCLLCRCVSVVTPLCHVPTGTSLSTFFGCALIQFCFLKPSLFLFKEICIFLCLDTCVTSLSEPHSHTPTQPPPPPPKKKKKKKLFKSQTATQEYLDSVLAIYYTARYTDEKIITFALMWVFPLWQHSSEFTLYLLWVRY